jgi:hypothetical protein
LSSCSFPGARTCRTGFFQSKSLQCKGLPAHMLSKRRLSKKHEKAPKGGPPLGGFMGAERGEVKEIGP